MNSPALEIESLSFSLGGRPVLHDVSVSIGAGERWSIIGPNGAGKSTLLKCLMRIHAGWRGRVRLFGRSLGEFSQRELARRVAYVPQAGSDGQIPFTVREFARMARYPYAGRWGASSPGDAEAVERALEHAGVLSMADRLVATLSGGERQKAYVAAALAQGGDVLLLDEPTAFLDYRHQGEVSEILRSIARESGTTIIAVTHDVNAAILAGGNALALRDGAPVYVGPVAWLMNERRLGEVYGAEFRFINDPRTGLRLVAPQGARA